MRNVSTQFLGSVLGSNSPLIMANVWRDGEVIRQDVQIAGGSIVFNAANAVESQLQNFTFVDDDPTAQLVDSFGCQVNVLAGFDLAGTTELVSMGWFDITQTSVNEAWSWFDWSSQAFLTSRVLTVQAQDYVSIVDSSDFLAPEQPNPGDDAWTTIANLCAGIVSVIDPGFTALTIPATGIIFQWSRLDAIKAIAKLWNAFPIMTENGQLTLATEDIGDTLPDFGARVNIDWWVKQSASAQTYNAVTFVGRGTDGSELVGYATETSGPLRWGGPFGFRPTRLASDLMTTQGMVNLAAQTSLATIIARRSVTQTVSALWNPAVELRDKVTLDLPDGSVAATVSGYTLPLLGGPMTVDLRLPWGSL